MPVLDLKKHDPVYGHSEMYLHVDYSLDSGLVVSKMAMIFDEDGHFKTIISQAISLSPDECGLMMNFVNETFAKELKEKKESENNGTKDEL